MHGCHACTARFLVQSFDGSEVMIAVIAIAAPSALCTALSSRRDTFEWLGIVKPARRLLEEARDRKAELNQALDDLAVPTLCLTD